MNKKSASVLAVLIIMVFIAYIVYDVISPETKNSTSGSAVGKTTDPDKWIISKVFNPGSGSLKAVAVSPAGFVFLAGDSWVTCYDENIKPVWSIKTDKPVTALSFADDTLYATTIETIMVIGAKGKLLEEWGPFEDSAIITSISADRSSVAFADAGNRIVVVLNKKGEVKKMIGKSDDPFVIPSPYFDAVLTGDTLFIANTGKRRIETRRLDGTLVRFCGFAGTAPEAFSGCCNPAHIAMIGTDFITAEKGINRIKIIDKQGKFVEFVSSVNKFIPSMPLDIATSDGKIIYAANPADGKLYVFKRE